MNHQVAQTALLGVIAALLLAITSILAVPIYVASVAARSMAKAREQAKQLEAKKAAEAEEAWASSMKELEARKAREREAQPHESEPQQPEPEQPELPPIAETEEQKTARLKEEAELKQKRARLAAEREAAAVIRRRELNARAEKEVQITFVDVSKLKLLGAQSKVNVTITLLSPLPEAARLNLRIDVLDRARRRVHSWPMLDEKVYPGEHTYSTSALIDHADAERVTGATATIVEGGAR